MREQGRALGAGGVPAPFLVPPRAARRGGSGCERWRAGRRKRERRCRGRDGGSRREAFGAGVACPGTAGRRRARGQRRDLAERQALGARAGAVVGGGAGFVVEPRPTEIGLTGGAAIVGAGTVDGRQCARDAEGQPGQQKHPRRRPHPLRRMQTVGPTRQMLPIEPGHGASRFEHAGKSMDSIGGCNRATRRRVAGAAAQLPSAESNRSRSCARSSAESSRASPR